MNIKTVFGGAFLATSLMLTTATTSFAGEGHATLTIETMQAVPGETIELGLALDANDLVGAFDIFVDSGKIMIDDIIYDGELSSAGWNGWDTAPGLNVSVSGACIFPADQVTGPQHLVSMQLTVPEDAIVGSFLTFDLASASVSNYQFTPYEITIVAGGIEVIESGTTCGADIAGDDNVVGIDDLLTLLEHWGPCAGACAADLNGDEQVNTIDLLALLGAWGPCAG